MLPRERRYPFFKGVPEKSHSTRFFNLRYRKREDVGVRVAVVVGKKVDARANVRNRVRRVFVEQIQRVVSDWRVGFDLVFYLRKEAVEADGDTLQASIVEALRKVGVVQ